MTTIELRKLAAWHTTHAQHLLGTVDALRERPMEGRALTEAAINRNLVDADYHLGVATQLRALAGAFQELCSKIACK